MKLEIGQQVIVQGSVMERGKDWVKLDGKGGTVIAVANTIASVEINNRQFIVDRIGDPRVEPALEIGAFVTHARNGRAVTFLGFDSQGWALFAEGHIDVRATHANNITI